MTNILQNLEITLYGTEQRISPILINTAVGRAIVRINNEIVQIPTSMLITTNIDFLSINKYIFSSNKEQNQENQNNENIANKMPNDRYKVLFDISQVVNIDKFIKKFKISDSLYRNTVMQFQNEMYVNYMRSRNRNKEKAIKFTNYEELNNYQEVNENLIIQHFQYLKQTNQRIPKKVKQITFEGVRW